MSHKCKNRKKKELSDLYLDIQNRNVRLVNRFSDCELIKMLWKEMNPVLITATLLASFRSIEELRQVPDYDSRIHVEYAKRRNVISEVYNDLNYLPLESVKDENLVILDQVAAIQSRVKTVLF